MCDRKGIKPHRLPQLPPGDHGRGQAPSVTPRPSRLVHVAAVEVAGKISVVVVADASVVIILIVAEQPRAVVVVARREPVAAGPFVADVVDAGLAGEVAVGRAAAAALPGSKALALPPCECPNIERMPLSSMAPPITPAAEAAAVPRNELPPVPTGAGPIGDAPMGDPPMPGEPIGGPPAAGLPAWPQTPLLPRPPVRGTEPRGSSRPNTESRMLSRKLRGGSSAGGASSSSMRAWARLSASSCTSTVCTSA